MGWTLRWESIIFKMFTLCLLFLLVMGPSFFVCLFFREPLFFYHCVFQMRSSTSLDFRVPSMAVGGGGDASPSMKGNEIFVF